MPSGVTPAPNTCAIRICHPGTYLSQKMVVGMNETKAPATRVCTVVLSVSPRILHCSTCGRNQVTMEGRL